MTTRDANGRKKQFRCEILDGGEEPRFRVTPLAVRLDRNGLCWILDLIAKAEVAPLRLRGWARSRARGVQLGAA